MEPTVLEEEGSALLNLQLMLRRANLCILRDMRHETSVKREIEALYAEKAILQDKINRLEALVELDAHFEADSNPPCWEDVTQEVDEETVAI